MRQNCQVKFKILLLSFADTSLYSCPQLYIQMSFAKHRSCQFTRTHTSLTHTHTHCIHRHGCVHRNVHATSIRNAKVLQLRSCKFVYANSHIVMCVSGPICMCVYVCVFVWVCKSHCVHVLAMCGCHLTRSTFIFWPLIAWSEPASTAAAQQFVSMCVCEVRETRSRACLLACWPTKCNINTFGIMVLTQFKLQLCGLFNASNRLQCIDCSVLCRALLDNGYIGNWIGCA